ncbi:MAG TPA: TIGR03435 family protein, partial [Acidobacteriaceae bacterium]
MKTVALAAFLSLAPLAVSAQTAPATRPAPANLAFEVASVHQSPEPDMRQLIANLNRGIKPESIHIDGERAVFTFMSLKRLVAYAYNAQTYEVTGPDWLATDRFDITATLPAGATKDEVPRMMQALLRDRFHMEARHATLDDQPVLAIQTGKSGAKLKPATAAPKALDLSQPLQPGQSLLESPTGAILLTRKPDGATTYDMGERGDFTLKFDTSSMAMQMTSNAITMSGVAV